MQPIARAGAGCTQMISREVGRTNLNPSLIAAYRAAHYEVSGVTPPFVLHVDVASAPLAALHQARGVACSAFLTACNPQGVAVAPAVNAEAQRRLEAELHRVGYPCVAGFGRDPDGCWPGEASLLVLGLARDRAIRVAGRFEQNALVWAGADATPALVLLR